MKGKFFWAGVLLVCFALGAAAQTAGGFTDHYIVKVKPEKRADFDAAVKKMAEAQRKHGGDRWIAAEVIYGDHGTIYFTSLRDKLAEVETGMQAFETAVGKAFGAGAMKLFTDFSNCLASSRGEIRRRRPDLSRNAPSDPAAMARLLGEARYVRTTMVRVRPGHVSHYTDTLMKTQAALQKADAPSVSLVSQSHTGQTGTVFYLTSVYPSFAAMDAPTRSLRELLGESGYAQYEKTGREAVMGSETYMMKFLPVLSNPPEEIVKVAPEFWAPKPAAKKAN